MRVGNRRDAKRALAGKFPKIGEGGSRFAYLSDEGVVYKVDQYEDEMYGCKRERQAYRRIKNFKFGVWRVARMSFYTVDGQVVTAAEYVKGEHPVPEYPIKDGDEPAYNHHWLIFDTVAKELGREDIHGDNVVKVSFKEFVIIDF